MIPPNEQARAGGVPNPGLRSAAGPAAPGVSSLVMRYRWKDIDNDDGTFNFARMDKELGQCEALGVQLVMLIEVRTFDNTNPAPPSLASFATFFANSGPAPAGYQMWRWHPTVLARFKLLVNAIGARYDGRAHFAGIGTQETANGGVTAGGYSPANYLAALKQESDFIAAASPSSRHFAYLNFMGPGVNNQEGTAMLLEYAAYIQKNGAVIGGPDLVVSGGIVDRCYPIYQAVHLGTSPVAAPGPTFCSVQSPEWRGAPPATHQTMQTLFNYATGRAPDGSASPLKLDIIIWDWSNSGGTEHFNPAVSVIAAKLPTFGTYTPSAAPATTTLTTKAAITTTTTKAATTTTRSATTTKAAPTTTTVAPTAAPTQYVSVGGAYEVARTMETANRETVLAGRVQPVAGATSLVLLSGLKGSVRVTHQAAPRWGGWTILQQENGQVSVAAVPPGWLSISGFSFYDIAGAEFTNAVLVNGVKNADTSRFFPVSFFSFAGRTSVRGHIGAVGATTVISSAFPPALNREAFLCVSSVSPVRCDISDSSVSVILSSTRAAAADWISLDVMTYFNWAPPTLLQPVNGYANFGGTFQVAGARKVDGIVFLHGMLRGTTATSSIVAQLPAVLAPAATQTFLVACSDFEAGCQIEVRADGSIAQTTGARSSWLSLSGIRYAQSAPVANLRSVTSSQTDNSVAIIVGSVVGGVVLAAALVGIVLLVRHRRARADDYQHLSATE